MREAALPCAQCVERFTIRASPCVSASARQRSLRLRAGSALAKELGSVRAFVVFVMTPLGSTYMDYRPRNHIIRHGC